MMNAPEQFSFQRYLAAKKTIDDRSLNAGVWQALIKHWPRSRKEGAPRVLEAGMGIGTMLQRLLERGVLTQGAYLGIDLEQANIQQAREWLTAWAEPHAYRLEQAQGGIALHKAARRVETRFRQGDILQYAQQPEAQRTWEVLIAHALLDLLPVPEAVPALLGLLRPGGLFYFTCNFDGETIFEPALDPEFDRLVVERYHLSMDQRQVNGRLSGDSQTGRHLFTALEQAGGRILEAGASDWVVYPRQGLYQADEAYFLYHILYFFESTLAGQFGEQEPRFRDWLAQRRLQVRGGELVYIAHQLDFLGRVGEYGGYPD